MSRVLSYVFLTCAVALAAFLFARESGGQLPAPVVAAVAPLPQPAPRPPPGPPPLTPALDPLPPVTFQSGFCADATDAETVSTRYTLGNLLATLSTDVPPRADVVA